MSTEGSEQGINATGFVLEQMYELARGLFSAYQVDTGRALDKRVRAWDELSPLEHLVFTMAVKEHLLLIYSATCKIGKAKS